MGLGAQALSPTRLNHSGDMAALSTIRGLKKTAVHADVPPPVAVKDFKAAVHRGGLDNQRQDRVFDPKVRTIGIDRQMLDDQLAERKELRNLEKRREADYDKVQVQMNKHQQHLQHLSDQIKLQRMRDLEGYRKTFQKTEGRREFELNDPNGKKKDLPARVGDDDPRCGPSSMQKFDGEDLSAAERKRLQAQKMREWAQQQQDEKALKKWIEDERNRRMEAKQEEVNQRVHELERLQKAQKAQARATNAEFNKRLAEQKKREAAAQRHRDTLNNLEEIQNALDSDFLGERAGTGRGDRFKGLPQDHLQAIRNEQAQQMQELRQRKIREAEEDLVEARKADQDRKMANAMQRQMDAEYQNLDKKVDEDRKVQAAAQREQAATRSRLYASEVGEQYFRPHLPTSFEECARIGKSTR
eukprot:Hpha_TRINITY_DN11104_c0_g1::TRINITY_DN11104_c0_g1_i1::g.28047::m.28047